MADSRISDLQTFYGLLGSLAERVGGARTLAWGHGSNAPADVRAGETALEYEVSKVICAMPFLWLAIDDEPGAVSLRGYVERNAIALLSNFQKEPIDPPSAGWLGHSCNRERVRKSGLWNQNRVEETYDPAFLGRFDRLVSEMGRAA